MNKRPNWQCPSCGEEHPGRFEVCWKCGATVTGEPSTGFQITEPVSECDQAPEGLDEESEVRPLELPAITYFSIPPCVFFSLLLMSEDMSALNTGEFPAPSRREMVLAVAAAVLIGIPIFSVLVQDMFYSILRRQRPEASLLNTITPWSMFRLPKSFCQMYRWFVPIYYGSIIAAIVVSFAAPIFVFGWKMLGSDF